MRSPGDIAFRVVHVPEARRRGTATCFLICTIDKPGTELRQHADDLLEELETALEVFDMRVVRGDHSISKEIDADVISQVQNAELCIADLSEDRPDVYYELGRRDETGKPIILIRRRGSGPLPQDIAQRRCIEYDIDTRRGAREFRNLLRTSVQEEASHGFEGSKGNATLAGVLEVIQRVERKLDRINTGQHTGGGTVTPTPVTDDLPDGLTPSEAFNLALRTRNIPLAEAAMGRLQWTMDKNRFYDLVVEQVASMGSVRATEMLFEYAEVFFDSDMSYRKKIEYLGVLVGSANRHDREQEVLELVERTAKMLDELAGMPGTDATAEDHAQDYNQLNRLYHGIYLTLDDEDYLNKAIDALRKALTIYQAPYLYFNLAVCERHVDLASARVDIDRCLELSTDNPDDDHLELACKIYREQGDPAYSDLLDRLRNINPQKAMLLSYQD